MSEKSFCLTLLLQAWRDGDNDAGEKVFSIVFSELQKVASAYIQREHEASLQTTELVNEAYLRLEADKKLVFKDRRHFFGIAARAMRQILVEQTRKRKAQKRAANLNQLTLNDEFNLVGGKPLDLLRLDEALKELETFDQKKARLVELRFFAGLSLEETSQALGISVSSVKREWVLAKAWLYNRLTQ